MVLLHIRNRQHVTLFHPERRFLAFSDEIGEFLFGTIQKKPKPERSRLEIIEMVESAQFLVFNDRDDGQVGVTLSPLLSKLIKNNSNRVS